MPHRIFIDNIALLEKADSITLTGADAKRMSRVLRLREKDTVTLFSDRGVEYLCAIGRISPKEVLLDIIEENKVDRESTLKITLTQALPKGKKMDFIIQKTTELGVDTIMPFVSSRSVSRPGGRDEKTSRWRAIAMEASRQSGRNRIPEISGICELSVCCDYLKAPHQDQRDLKLVLWEEEKAMGIKQALNLFAGKSGDSRIIDHVTLMVGPEGGFTSEEIAYVKKRGFVPVTIGKRILRAETAAIAAVAILQCLSGDID